MSSPKYLCRVCNAVICPSCREIAEEHERLNYYGSLDLFGKDQEIQSLKQEVAALKRRLTLAEEERVFWADIAKAGFPEMMKRWIESEVWIAATKPPKSEIAKARRRLAKALRESWIQNKKEDSGAI